MSEVDWDAIRKRTEEMKADPAKISKKELWVAIRAHCMECGGEGHVEVRQCGVPDCALFKYRFGLPPKKVRAHNIDYDGTVLDKEPEVVDETDE